MFPFRRFIEILLRNKVIKRRLPREFGSLPIYISPDSQLKYIKLSKHSAFDKELLYIVDKYIKKNFVVWDIEANVGIFSFTSNYKVGKGGNLGY